MSASPSATQPGKSRSPGRATSGCGRSTTPRHPRPGGRRAEHVIATFATCPIPEIARLGRTLRAWQSQVLAYFTTSTNGGVSNGGTEAVNLIIEKTRRLAHGFRNFHNYRLRILLAADGTRPYRRAGPTHA
jgi:transposase